CPRASAAVVPSPPSEAARFRRSGLATGPRHHARGARSVRSPNSTCSLYSEEGRCLTGRPEEDGGQGGEGGGRNADNNGAGRKGTASGAGTSPARPANLQSVSGPGGSSDLAAL
ncbi:unnamed protein product, partial [Prorocentrum cordatum]